MLSDVHKIIAVQIQELEAGAVGHPLRGTLAHWAWTVSFSASRVSHWATTVRCFNLHGKERVGVYCKKELRYAGKGSLVRMIVDEYVECEIDEIMWHGDILTNAWLIVYAGNEYENVPWRASQFAQR